MKTDRFDLETTGLLAGNEPLAVDYTDVCKEVPGIVVLVRDGADYE